MPFERVAHVTILSKFAGVEGFPPELTGAAREASATYESANRLLIATIIGAVVAAMAIGFYVARSLANPLKLMAAAANGIAEGDLEQEITLDRKDEVGQAAAGFRRAIAYLRGMAEVADAMAEGDLTRTVEPQSARDGLGTSNQGKTSGSASIRILRRSSSWPWICSRNGKSPGCTASLATGWTGTGLATCATCIAVASTGIEGGWTRNHANDACFLGSRLN